MVCTKTGGYEMKDKFVVKDAAEESHFLAGDLCSLAEILHPKKENLPFSGFSLSHAEVLPKGRTLPHRLAESSEIYWIIKGNGTLFINGTAVELKKGRAVLVPPSAEQYVVNSGDEILEFLCMVSPPWELSDECIL
jgi:mannose-6-phosphate isomerase-like protein (cupin superfamily)